MSKEQAEIFRFKAGDEVPEWIVSQEPLGPQSAVQPLRFVMDAIVIDGPTAMFVCLASGGGDPGRRYDQVIGMFGMNSRGVRLVGTSKIVLTAAAWTFISRFDAGVTRVPLEDVIRFHRGETHQLGPDMAVPPYEDVDSPLPPTDTRPWDRVPTPRFDPFPSRRNWQERLTAAWLALFS